MTDHITHVVLRHKGKTYQPGSTVALDEETAKALGSNVTIAAVAAPEKPLDELTVKKLRELGKVAGVANYWEKDKAQLVAALKAVADNEPSSG